MGKQGEYTYVKPNCTPTITSVGEGVILTEQQECILEKVQTETIDIDKEQLFPQITSMEDTFTIVLGAGDTFGQVTEVEANGVPQELNETLFGYTVDDSGAPTIVITTSQQWGNPGAPCDIVIKYTCTQSLIDYLDC